MTESRKLPQGRIGRVARLASLGARGGLNALTRKSASVTATQAAEVLGTMRGLAAKVGQMASYVDGMVPEAHRAAFEASLKTLQNAAPSSSFKQIKASCETELGAPLDALFATFEETPFASASIGQVHRATLSDGRDVAVKVQHPGIQKAVESDLKNAGMLETMVGGLGGRKFDTKRLLSEVRARFLEELNYELEAERQNAFRALHKGDDKIRIPAVIAERSARRVITSEFVRGRSLEEAAQAPEVERRQYAETLWRFVFKGNLVGQMFNADPHPGNYLFQDDGGIAFLDFGCVQPIEGDRHDDALKLHQAALRLDEEAFEVAAKRLLGTKGGRYEELAVAYSRMCFRPLFDSPFAIDRKYTVDLMAEMQKFGKQARSLLDDGYVPLPPGMIFMNRLQFGFYSVLARLNTSVDYRAVEQRFLREADLWE